MDLRTFLAVIWRRRLVVAITTIVAVIAAAVGLMSLPPEYVASTTLRVGTASTGSPDWPTYDLQYTDRLMNTYKTMVTSDRMATQVMQQLGLQKRPTIAVSIPANTELMEIQATDAVPLRAQQVANAVSNLIVQQLDAQWASSGQSSTQILKPQIDLVQQELDQARAQLDQLVKNSPSDTASMQALQDSIQLKTQTYTALLSQYQSAQNAEALHSNRLTVIQAAMVPTAPSRPSKLLVLPLGALLGLLGGMALTFLLENFDTRLHSTREIETLAGVPVLGKIPQAADTHGALYPIRSPQEEAFRRLRTNLLARETDAPLGSVLVTSSQPGEGKSTTVANLAMALAQSGRRVVVVDADLRKPTLHQMFKVSNVVGLSSVLMREATLDDAIQFSMVPGIQVLASGPASNNPAELLGLRQMEDVLRELAGQFDLVLIDTPSLETVTDAALLSLIVGGVLLVVARGQARRESVLAALGELDNVQMAPLGVVVTRGETSAPYRYGQQQSAETGARVRTEEDRSSWSVPLSPLPVAGGERPMLRRVERDDRESVVNG
ncbi:MAG TPA: polysaccharide biosynthesis tyrosine autokinase [Thermomicrobiaceae bacterium]|nr:polysaccharide biosynthesis tyrosine autokinase [Thermomicrobiaceae bacterium]